MKHPSSRHHLPKLGAALLAACLLIPDATQADQQDSQGAGAASGSGSRAGIAIKNYQASRAMPPLWLNAQQFKRLKNIKPQKRPDYLSAIITRHMKRHGGGRVEIRDVAALLCCVGAVYVEEIVKFPPIRFKRTPNMRVKTYTVHTRSRR